MARQDDESCIRIATLVYVFVLIEIISLVRPCHFGLLEPAGIHLLRKEQRLVSGEVEQGGGGWFREEAPSYGEGGGGGRNFW